MHSSNVVVALLFSLFIGLDSATSTIAIADEKMLFDLAVTIPKEFDDAQGDRYGQLKCFDALAGLRCEREAWQILQVWSLSNDDRHQGGFLRSCWRNELYWVGMNLAEQSNLTFSEKLASLGGCPRPPPNQLVTQLLNLNAEALHDSDQDMAALLRFAAIYDEDLHNNASERDLSKVVSVAIDVAPRALRLLETSYPPEGYFFHFHPVREEVYLCSLAMLSIVPDADRSDSMKTLLEQVSGNLSVVFTCSERGWIQAAETGFDLESDDDDAAFIWRSALVETLNVDLRGTSRLAIPAPSDEQRELQLWRIRIRKLMEDLRNRVYLQNPDRLSRYFQEQDTELWTVQVLLILEVARVRRDNELLVTAANELLKQSDRIYDFANPSPNDPVSDLDCLYHSALRAARRTGNRKLQDQLTSRVIQLIPAVLEESRTVHGNDAAVLSHFGGEIPAWTRELCVGSAELDLVERFENTVFEVDARRLPFSALGACWVVNGASREKMERLFRLCNTWDDESALLHGVGIAVGFGASPFGLRNRAVVIFTNFSWPVCRNLR